MTARLVILVVLSAAATARGGSIDSPTRRQLVELKRVCDAGLVAPVVCLEKQRALLGLPAAGGTAEVARPLAAEAPAVVSTP